MVNTYAIEFSVFALLKFTVCIFFCVWLILFNLPFVRFLPIVAYGRTLFVFTGGSAVYIHYNSFILSTIDGFLCHVLFGAVVSIAAMAILSDICWCAWHTFMVGVYLKREWSVLGYVYVQTEWLGWAFRVVFIFYTCTAAQEWYHWSIFPLTYFIVRFSGGLVVLSHCDCHLLFSDYSWDWISFHVFISVLLCVQTSYPLF